MEEKRKKKKVSQCFTISFLFLCVYRAGEAREAMGKLGGEGGTCEKMTAETSTFSGHYF